MAKKKASKQEARVAAGQFKARCLQLMDEVAEKRMPLVITKHGRPVAKLVPIDEEAEPDLFGCLAGTARIQGDLAEPVDEAWEAER